MSRSIAVSGKGGTGKTTLTGLIIRHLLKAGETPVLAVDADPNSNLGDTVGVEIGRTVGSTVAEFFGEKMKIPAGISKESYLEMKLNEILAEAKGIDLLPMGRGEGPGCYCFPNLMVRKFVDELSGNYKFVVMDNQAGMEHLSRRTTQNIDEMLLVSDHTVKGLRAVARIRDLIRELKLVVNRESVIINQVPGEIDPRLEQEMERLGITPAAVIPDDNEIRQYDLEQKPLSGLPETSRAAAAVNALMDKLMLKTGVGSK